MNGLAQPLGLSLIAIAVGAFIVRIAAVRGLVDRRWGFVAVAVIMALLACLFGLIAYYVLLGPFD